LPREITAGQEMNLRARFKDDLGTGTQASGVWLHIFEPSVDVDEDGTGAYFSTNTGYEYLGEGIYQYGFTPPDNAAEGTWVDFWIGILNSQVVSGEFYFSVYSGGEAEEIGNQLFVNNLVEIILSSGIMATDGIYLEDGYSFEFLTTISPSYTTIRKIKLEAGGFINQLPDLTIQMAILEASLEADQLDFTGQNSYASKNTAFFEHARREWTTCKVTLGLIDNLTTSGLKAKTLGDLHVEYDTNIATKTLQRILACLERWEPQLLSGGLSRDAQQPRGVVKGEYDPDRPTTGRLWESSDSSYSDRYPASNTEETRSYQRRSQNIYKKGKRWW